MIILQKGTNFSSDFQSRTKSSTCDESEIATETSNKIMDRLGFEPRTFNSYQLMRYDYAIDP